MTALACQQTFQQIHGAVFWQEPYPFVALWQLQSHRHLPTDPVVCVAISQSDDCLHLSYFIEKKPWLKLDNLSADQINRQDYLWQQNCLECFVALSEDCEYRGYLEINVSPNGAYNLYRFDDYRTPKQMPPVQDTVASLLMPTFPIVPMTDNTPPLTDWHSRHVTIQLGDYHQRYAHHNNTATCIQINPCVILYQDRQPIYYARQHANPPDFHNRQHWQSWRSG